MSDDPEPPPQNPALPRSTPLSMPAQPHRSVEGPDNSGNKGFQIKHKLIAQDD